MIYANIFTLFSVIWREFVRSFGGNLFGRLAQFCSVIWHFYPLNRTNVSLISVELVPFV